MQDRVTQIPDCPACGAAGKECQGGDYHQCPNSECRVTTFVPPWGEGE